MRKNRFGVTTVLLILFIAFCVKGTVMSKGKAGQAEENKRYVIWEQTFMEQTRNTLAGQGYPNSGITMNWVKSDGKRTYTIAVHHKRIERLAKEEQERLSEMILRQNPQEENCEIYIVF